MLADVIENDIYFCDSHLCPVHRNSARGAGVSQVMVKVDAPYEVVGGGLPGLVGALVVATDG